MAKKKKMSKADEKALNDKIKEQKKAKAAKVEAPKDKELDFDAWHSMRRHQIGSTHFKEVILVYMKSIGLSTKETTETYDAALERYGIKLK